MNRFCLSACAVALAIGMALAADSRQGAWRIVPEGAKTTLSVPLPALAKVTSTDASGQTWQQTGEIGGTVAAVRGEFVMALCSAGWVLNKTIVLGRSSAESELMIWTGQKRRILFKVWEKEAGTCGFAWGEER